MRDSALLGLAAFALLGVLSCQDDEPPPPPTPPIETESPNARILPTPLPRKGQRTSRSGAGPRGVDETAAARRKPLPVVGALPAEAATGGVASGVVLEGRFSWPGVKKVVRAEGNAFSAWPRLRVELLPAFEEAPARARIVLESSVWALPKGTELRARSDREGFIVVWPDDRSYRVVSQGALQSLFEERRVDRMPVVTMKSEEVGEGRRLGRTTRKVRLENALGTVKLDLALVPESGIETGLMCDFLLGLLRAVTPAGVCEDGVLPFAAHFLWEEGRSLEFSVTQMTLRTDLSRDMFLLPPKLSIYKPGELPPGSSSLWPSDVLAAVFPREPNGPKIRFHNYRSVPLFLMIDSVPVSRIDPHSEVVWSAGRGEHRHVARDFLGKVTESAGVVQAPAEVAYGEPPSPED